MPYPHYTYDVLNRRTNVVYKAAGADVSASLSSTPYYIYDEVSNLVRMGDLWGLQLFGYDALNRLTQRKYPNGSAVYYSYDAVSNRIGLKYPGTAGTSGAGYDAANRQTKVQAPSGATAYFTYDLSPNPIQKLLGNNVKASIVYDADDRIQNWRYASSAGASLSYFDYSRDPKGLLTKAVREANYTVYYAYDANDRLASEIWAKTGASPSEVYGYRYAYDVAGNRIKARVNLANTYYFYDQANQLKVTGSTSAWATPSYYIYDKNGSLTNLVEPAGATYFAYNTAGLVARIRWKDASATYFFYDGNLQRYGMVAAGTATYFLWDGPNLLQEQNKDGTVKEEYTNARTSIPGIGQLIEINRPGQTPQKIYPVMDPRGTITKQLQGDGTTVQAAKEYDAFGNVIPNSATGTWIGRFTYQGQAWMEIGPADASKRLLLSPTRIYDPVTGRFLQNEPLLRNRPYVHYLYCEQNPLRFVDPLGLQGWDPNHMQQQAQKANKPAASSSESEHYSSEAMDSYMEIGLSDTIEAWRLSRQAEWASIVSGIPGTHNGPADAYRHCMWACLMARQIGDDKARFVLANHEYWGNRRDCQPKEEEKMDMWNNIQGINASKGKGTCDDECRKSMNEGRLYTIPVGLAVPYKPGRKGIPNWGYGGNNLYGLGYSGPKAPDMHIQYLPE